MLNLYSFAEFTKTIRKHARLNQSEFAESLGVSKILVAKIESGMQEPSKKFVQTLAERLKVHPSTLMPFLAFTDDGDTESLSKAEKAMMLSGQRMQNFILQKRSHLLKTDGKVS